MNQDNKKFISPSEFEKKILIEYSYCQYFEYMNSSDSYNEAFNRVSKHFTSTSPLPEKTKSSQINTNKSISNTNNIYLPLSIAIF